jgi:hypothetical protein
MSRDLAEIQEKSKQAAKRDVSVRFRGQKEPAIRWGAELPAFSGSLACFVHRWLTGGRPSMFYFCSKSIPALCQAPFKRTENTLFEGPLHDDRQETIGIHSR